MKRKGNNIGWCDITVNPVTGCPNGCEYCYARSMNNRWKWVEDFSRPEFFPYRLKDFCTKEPMIIFIDSMSDIGYWEPDWRACTWLAMTANRHNIYLALTKHYNAIDSLRARMGTGVQFYIGATVTNNAQAQAVIDAGGADFISFEPLLERIRPELLLQLQCKWWIVGDLTKNGKPQYATRPWWVNSMVDYAKEYKMPIFMKDSLKSLHEHSVRGFIQQFPEGWKA